MNKKKTLIFAFALLIMVIICKQSGIYKNLSAEGIKGFILSFGVFAPVVYIIMFTFVPLTLFPDSLLAIAGGMVFGLFWGSIFTLIGALCGGTLAFFISRCFGREVVEKLVRHKAQWFEAGVEKRGFLLVLTLRLIPLIPFDIISYGAGLSKVRYIDFITGTILGIIPGVLIYVNLGDKALNVFSPEFMCAAGMLLALFMASCFARKYFSFTGIQNKLIETDNK